MWMLKISQTNVWKVLHQMAGKAIANQARFVRVIVGTLHQALRQPSCSPLLHRPAPGSMCWGRAAAGQACQVALAHVGEQFGLAVRGPGEAVRVRLQHGAEQPRDAGQHVDAAQVHERHPCTRNLQHLRGTVAQA